MPLFHQNVGRERRLTQTLHTGKYRYLPLFTIIAEVEDLVYTHWPMICF